jgi:hypothetical protein
MLDNLAGRFRQFNLAARASYDLTRQRANAALPLFRRVGSVLTGINQGIQASTAFRPESKTTARNVHGAIDQMIHRYTTAVNKWNLIHEVATAPG